MILLFVHPVFQQTAVLERLVYLRADRLSSIHIRYVRDLETLQTSPDAPLRPN